MNFLRRDRLPGLATLRARLRASVRSPLAWILVISAVLRVVGIGWGLPASDGWDNDGIAPRDFLAGLVETFTPGHYFTYPPLHLLLLGVLTFPVTAIALLHAPSLAPHDVIGEILKVPYMTSIAYIARATTLVMSVGVTYAVAKIAETARGRRAGWCAAAVCAVDPILTYYSHTTNLDVPYLFWGMFALLALTRAIAWNEPRRLRHFVILALLGVATKDQAYALFLVAAPIAFLAWLAIDPVARGDARAIVRELLTAVGIGAVLFVFVDGIIWNPTGFRARLAFLVGPASKDFANYANDAAGWLRVLHDIIEMYSRLWPTAFLVLAAGGLLLQLRRRAGEDRATWLAGLVPFLAAVSFTVAFNCVALRVEHRFILPQSIIFSIYAGLAVHAFLFELRGRFARVVAQAALSVAFASAIFRAVAVDVSLLFDPRYDAERYMREHFAPGDRVETYGLNVYLTRFPDNVHVARVGLDAPQKRNPMPGFEEIEDRFENVEARKPRWIVLPYGWAWRYLIPIPDTQDTGKTTPTTQIKTRGDHVVVSFFHELLEGRRGYRVVHIAEYNRKVWPRVDIHASTDSAVWILERM
ncbi:glycosyltransferase family 39 protein [Pendulispora rubella]|uniref:Glycosyltransferase family 39 protein n=1 Tax=Pendulispora rubella TaxID=2741070 RepID=A0ABZ2L9E6_9BACT